jgi:hypothetical protein
VLCQALGPKRVSDEAVLAVASTPLRLSPSPAEIADANDSDERRRGGISKEVSDRHRRGTHATLLPSGGAAPRTVGLDRWRDYASVWRVRKEKRALTSPPFSLSPRLGRELYHFHPLPPTPDARRRVPKRTSWMLRVRRRAIFLSSPLRFPPSAAIIGACVGAHDPPLAGRPIPHSRGTAYLGIASKRDPRQYADRGFQTSSPSGSSTPAASGNGESTREPKASRRDRRAALEELVRYPVRPTAHSSSGLGRRPLTAVARVRIPYAPSPGQAGL